MYNCQEIANRQIWDDFVTSSPSHTFLHSWNWGEFNEQMGDRVWRIGIFEDSKIVAAALVIKVKARRGGFLFIPHGPVFAMGEKITNNQDTITKQLIERLKILAKQENTNFIRVSPLLTKTDANERSFRQLGFRPAPIHMHAEITWTLDLSPSEDELLVNMRKTTRNLIRRAAKEGVKIEAGDSQKEFEGFGNLYLETAKRHKFVPFSQKYLKTQLETFRKDNSVKIFNAWYDNRILASAIVVFYGKSAYYHHGASVPSKIPAAYLLQWEAIKEAKRRGHRFYNFWGIIPKNAPRNHPWAGITLFKKGFGGFQTDHVHAQDMPISWRYWVNWGVETMRRRRRNL